MAPRVARIAVALLILVLRPVPAQGAEEAARAALELDSGRARVGDHVGATLTVTLPEGWRLRSETIGPRLGPLTVFEGDWEPVQPGEGGSVRRWVGRLGAFRTGTLEVPPIELQAERDGEILRVASTARTLEIVSVLDEQPSGEGPPEIADIKPPVSLAANFGPLLAAAGLLTLLLALAGALWWAQRRWASRLAAVPGPDDPFRREPPHEWVYRELQRLLERRWPEQGQVDRFYAELSSILKRYLGGRYRLDLMERTTSEIGPCLEQGGADRSAIDAVVLVLAECDQVKFARERPGPEAWRHVVESVYRVVDRTRPAEARPPAEQGAA